MLLAAEVSQPLACPADVSRKMEQDLLSSFLKVGRAQVTHLSLHSYITNAENSSPKKAQGVSLCVYYIECAEIQILSS